MRKLSFISVLFALSLQAFAVEPDANSLLADSARSLDFRAHQSLGIGIQHLALLLQAGPRELFRKDTLAQNGSWVLLKELESKGFVTVRETSMPGEPQGSSAVIISPTAKGQAVLAALRGK